MIFVLSILAALVTAGLAWLTVHTLSAVLIAAPAWFTRNIIAPDPNPAPSRLDRLDGL